ncbi:MAG: hypothetical protein [Bacteriophage sp.]|nr:MAG: hypothetical protein [Bacteriophage sp.]
MSYKLVCCFLCAFLRASVGTGLGICAFLSCGSDTILPVDFLLCPVCLILFVCLLGLLYPFPLGCAGLFLHTKVVKFISQFIYFHLRFWRFGLYAV